MTEWWRGGVIYQIYPRSFMDASGDGVGDLRGIIGKLDYVAGLGVDAVWLSPIFTSPMADMGYDVSNYTDIDPLFGTLEDFDDLVAKAHELGLKLMIDQVLSHTSDRHPWFIESKSSRTNPRADWYVWADPKDDGTPPNNWPSVFGGPAWEWNGVRRQYYLHNFLTGQPDLNFHNREVQDAILDTMAFWLDRGVDGFRFDTVNYYFHDDDLRDNPPAPLEEETPLEADPYGMQFHLYSKNRPENLDFLRRVRALMDRYPGTTTVGEVGEAHRPIEIMAEYTAGDDLLHMCYSFAMLGDAFTPEHFRGTIERFFAGAPDGWPCWSFSNHDVNRHMTRWQGHAASTLALGKLSIALLLSLRGSVCIYQGEELGLPEAELDYSELTDPPGLRFWPHNKGRDGCRTPMPWTDAEFGGFSVTKPWLPMKSPHRVLNVDKQEADRESLLHFYRAILAYRKAHPALSKGEIAFPEVEAPLFAAVRWTEDDALVCVLNLSPNAVNVRIEGLPTALELAPVSSGATLERDSLRLAGNGFAYIEAVGVKPEAIAFSPS